METKEDKKPVKKKSTRTNKPEALVMKVVGGNSNFRQHTPGSVGYDLNVTVDTEITKESRVISTGIRIELPESYFGMVVPRSSLKNIGIVFDNKVGIIDNDYRGDIKLPLRVIGSHDKDKVFLQANTRVAQLLVLPYASPKVEFVDSLSPTSRGTGGFGSTGA